MKKQYEKPSMSIDMFEANEYIAACYRIKCNVPYGYGFIDSNKNGKRDENEAKFGQGTGCGTYHVATGLGADGPTENAMWQPLYPFTNREYGKPYGVFYWQLKLGGNNTGYHFSKVSDAQWEPNPNAS